MIICFTRKFLSNHWKAYTVIKYQKFPSKDKDEVGKHIKNAAYPAMAEYLNLVNQMRLEFNSAIK